MMRYTILGLMSLLLFACNKDNHNPYCIPIPEGNPYMQGWNYLLDTSDSNNLGSLIVNPANGSELIISVNKVVNGKYRFYKYNMNTHALSLFLEDIIPYKLSWGKNGWILFGHTDGTVWKIKDNGDSLSQIPGIFSAYTPTWNYKEDRFSVHRSDLTVGKAMLLYDFATATVVDTYYNVYADPLLSYINDSLLCYTMYDNVQVYNTRTKADEVIVQYPSGGSFQVSFPVCTGEDIVYSGSDGVYKVNIKTHEAARIVASCSSKRYRFSAYSPQLGKLFFLVSEFHDANTDKNTIIVSSYVVMMNLDGTGEERVPITIKQ